MFCIYIQIVGFLETYLPTDLMSLLVSVGQAAGRYEKMHEDITHVKEHVLGIKSTLGKVEGDLYADIAEVNNKATAVQNKLDNNLNETGTISDEMEEFRTEIHRQAQLNEINTKEIKRYRAVLNEEYTRMRVLETLLKGEQTQRENLEMKHFRLIVIIVMLFVAAWCVRERSMNSAQCFMDYKTNDTTRQSGAMPYGAYEMSVSEKLSTFDTTINKNSIKFSRRRHSVLEFYFRTHS